MLIEAFETAFPNHTFEWRHSGSGALGFCPFHNDKHQRSLSIYVDSKGRERWYCFAEGMGGNLIDMVMKSGNPDTNTRAGANYWLVQKGYLQETEQQVQDRIRNDGLRLFYKWTNDLLRNSDEASGVRAYLAGRHIDMSTLPSAPVGFYPKVSEVEAWLTDNDLYNTLGAELIPDRRTESIAVGSIIFFYRSSYEEFSRLKLRNVCKETNGNKIIMFLGKKLRKTEKLGYFSWSMSGCPDDDAILVEGEFDVGALASLVYKSNEDAIEPIYCFSGGSNLTGGVSVLLDMGKENLYIFPDNDGPGIDYSYTIAEQHPQTFIIMPQDYKNDSDPASWAADHTVEDLNKAIDSKCSAFSWIGCKLAMQAQDATLEEQASIKKTLIEYAKKLPATDRELFLRNYGVVAQVSFESLLEEVEDRSNTPYRKVLNAKNYGILMNVVTAKSSEWQPISNVILDFDRDLILDAGDGELERRIVIKASTANKSVKISMSPEEYMDDKKLASLIVEHLGSEVWIKPRSTSYLREACSLLSGWCKTNKEETILMHTGWKDGKFYHPEGYIDADGAHELDDIKVELPQNPSYMRNYKLDPPPSDLEFIKGIIKDHLVKVFPYYITLPYLAHIFLSPLSEFIPRAKPYCLWVVGQTGSFKTSYTGVMASFFGDFKYGDFETWRSTVNAIEKNGYYLKNMPYVVDDYKGIDISSKQLTTCLQNYGDRHGRSRLSTDLESRKTWYIRGNLISTAEDVPTGETSVIARILLLRILQRGNSDHLREAQSYAYMFPGVMSKFIQFICQEKPKVRDLDLLLTERGKLFNAQHSRVAESMAANSIAWDYVSRFLGLEDLTEEYYKGLETVLLTMNTTTQQEQAGFIFTETLSGMIASGSHYLQGVLGEDDTEHTERSARIGWITPKAVYIVGQSALAEINKVRTQLTGMPIKYSTTAIYDQLLANGSIIPDKNGKPTKVVKIERSSVRVLEFPRGVLENYDEASGDSSKLKPGYIRNSEKDTGLEC